MIAFDTENSPDGILTLCIFYDGNEYIIFDYKKYTNQYNMKTAIIEYMIDSDEKLFLAHNLEYDLCNILKPDFFYVMNWYYSGRLLYAELNCEPKKKYIDTFNFSFSNLKTIGKNIGIEKIDTDEFYNIDYCKRDAEITYHYYKNFSEKIKSEYDLKCKKTLAGTSQNILLKKFVRKKIDERNIDRRLLAGYYGGRCEVFNLSRIDRYIVELDVNSMYPTVMKGNLYPGNEFYESAKPLESRYMARVTVTINEAVYLPVIPKRDKLLYFPTGKFETYVTSMEIEKAEQEGQIKELIFHEVYNFPECEDLFSGFVDSVYGEREKAKNDGREFDSLVYKYILNSSYGRFALNKEMRILTMITDENEDDIEPVDDSIGWITIQNDSGNNKNFAVAAFVTAYSRIVLWELINKIIILGYTPLYSDTDSCYFTTSEKIPLNDLFENIQNEFTINNGLGNLSAKIYAGGQFHNAKVYEIYDIANQHKLKLKGIPEKFRREFLDTGMTTYKKPMKLRAGLRGIQAKEINVWYDHHVERRGEYKKRRVKDDGTTLPRIFNL